MSGPETIPATAAALVEHDDVLADPIAVMKAFTALVRSTGLYPAGHPVVEQALQALEDAIHPHLGVHGSLQIDLIAGDAHVDAQPFRQESLTHGQVLREFQALGLDSLHVASGVTRDELGGLAACLVRRDGGDLPAAAALVARGITHLTIGRLLPLDTRWQTQDWPDAPAGPLDPDYAEALRRAEDALGGFAAGEAPGADAIRDLLQLLIAKVANSHVALGQIMAVKQYENHTYCHSVNVAILSLLLGRQVGLDETMIAALVEGALLHDVGKTRVPVSIIKKPSALSKRERRIVERHPSLGAAMLAPVPGLGPLTPMIALEHHRHWQGGGYPDLGDAHPHLLSQMVMIADTYEAITGARSYRPPTLPEQACLILARLAGERLNPALVRAFCRAVTFFPPGSLVRTSLDEVGVVVRTIPDDPLHPVIVLTDGLDASRTRGGEIDTSERDGQGAYIRHIAESLRPVSA